MISIVPKLELTAEDIILLRKLTERGIAEIKKASSQRISVRDIHIFGSEWDSERRFLGELCKEYSAMSNPPYVVAEVETGSLADLNPDEFKSRLKHWRSIELEQQMRSDLELGYIKSEHGFEPHDDDWTEPTD